MESQDPLNSAHWLGNFGKRAIPILQLLAEAIGVKVHFQRYEEARSLLRQITAEQRGAFNDTFRFAMLLLDHADAGAS